MIVTIWSRTQIKSSKRITKKEKELTVVITRVEQYWNIKKHNSKFDYKKQ